MQVHGQLRECLHRGDFDAGEFKERSRAAKALRTPSAECGICESASVPTRSNSPIICFFCMTPTDFANTYYIRPTPVDKDKKKTGAGTTGDDIYVCIACISKHPSSRATACVNRSDLCPDRAACSTCARSFHRVCALLPLDDATPFECPDCHPPQPLAAPLCRSLRKSAIGDQVEGLVGVADICVREVSRVHAVLDLSDISPARFQSRTLPVLPHVQRTLCFFCREVVVFAMSVHEFDQDDAGVNTNRFFIHYLDSAGAYCDVKFGTFVQAYIRSAQLRGFENGHLWVNSPGGLWFYFNDPCVGRPVLTDAQLNDWYALQFADLRATGAIDDITDFWDLFPKNKMLEKFDEIPLFDDAFLKYLALGRPLRKNLEKFEGNTMLVLHLSPAANAARAPPEDDLFSSIFETREAFLAWQETERLRMSDYRMALHFSVRLVETLLQEQAIALP